MASTVKDLAALVRTYRELMGGLESSELKLDEGFTESFVSSLSRDKSTLINFLMEAGLLVSVRTCYNCGKPMSLVKRERAKNDGLIWSCGKRLPNGKKCNNYKSIRDGSWFTGSHLPLGTILLLTGMLLERRRNEDICRICQVYHRTVSDWRSLVNSVIVDYVETHSVQIGGEGVMVKIDESRFVRRKYSKEDVVEGHWIVGGKERGSNKMFLVAVNERTRETLSEVIEDWVLPGSVVLTDCWRNFDRFSKQHYRQSTVKHNYFFVDLQTGKQTDTIESMWHHIGNSVPPPGSNNSFIKHLAHNLFNRKIKNNGKQDVMIKFLDIIRRVDWTEYKLRQAIDEYQSDNNDDDSDNEDEDADFEDDFDYEDEKPSRKVKRCRTK